MVIFGVNIPRIRAEQDRHPHLHLIHCLHRNMAHIIFSTKLNTSRAVDVTSQLYRVLESWYGLSQGQRKKKRVQDLGIVVLLFLCKMDAVFGP